MNNPNRPVTGCPASAGVGALPPNPNGYGGPVPQPLSGTDYPYAVEPPSSAAYYHHNPYYQPNHYATQRATCFRRVISIAIGAMVFMVFYESASLSDTTVPPFFQDKRAVTAQKASFATSGVYVDNWAFDGMNKERSTKGAIGFNVRMVSRVRFKAGAWTAMRRFVRVYCKYLSVGVGVE